MVKIKLESVGAFVVSSLPNVLKAEATQRCAKQLGEIRKHHVAALRLSKWRMNVQSLVVRECIAAANSQGGAITCALRNVLVQLQAQGALLRARRGS